MAVRDARPSDAVGIATVHVRSWEAAYRGLIPDRILDETTVVRRTRGWLRRLDTDRDAGTFVAVADDRIVGFVDVGPDRDDPTLGEVYAIYVDPDAWDRGHGRDLMVAGLEWLRAHGFASARLRVLEGNARGRSFYERGGWRLDGEPTVDDHAGVPLQEVTYRIDL